MFIAVRIRTVGTSNDNKVKRVCHARTHVTSRRMQYTTTTIAIGLLFEGSNGAVRPIYTRAPRLPLHASLSLSDSYQGSARHGNHLHHASTRSYSSYVPLHEPRCRRSGTKWTLLHATEPIPVLRRRETSSASGRQPLSAGHDMRLMLSKVLMCNNKIMLVCSSSCSVL